MSEVSICFECMVPVVPMRLIYPEKDTLSSITIVLDSNESVKEIISELLKRYRFDTDDIAITYNRELVDHDMTANELSIINPKIDYVARYMNAGGDFFGYWRVLYPYLDQLGTVLGISGAVVGFGTWIKNKFNSNDNKTRQVIDFFTSKDSWTVQQFADYLDIDKEEAKHLLKGFGYEWDNIKHVYVKTSRTDKIVSKCKTYVKSDFPWNHLRP